MDPHPLDDPVGAALRGEHARFARTAGRALGYRPDVEPFVGWLPSDEPAWEDLARLLGPGGQGILVGKEPPPPEWSTVWAGGVLQMVAEGAAGRADPELVPLGDEDVPDMISLVRRTRPGPFEARTIELGGYLGLRDDDGRLLAMAGERFKAPGYGEVSAVCTHPDHRGRGLGTRLVLAVMAALVERGLTPFLHVARDNHGAIRVYERLGFEVRRELFVVTVAAPG